MIGLVDPAFLLPQKDECDELPLKDAIARIIRTCRDQKIVVPEFKEYWPYLWKELGRPLEDRLSNHKAKEAVRQLRNFGRNADHLVSGVDVEAKAFSADFSALFEWEPAQPDWKQRMADAVARACSIPGEEVVIFVRRMKDRNVKIHATGATEIWENTRWRLRVQSEAYGVRVIPCIYHPRNLKVAWTRRYDWRLPAECDDAKYPFCPSRNWSESKTKAVDTISGKPAWVDAFGNGWCRPAISGGAGYHWDVFIRDRRLESNAGINQINVTAYGGPEGEGSPGGIHHVPRGRRSRLRDRGWSCK